MAHDDMGKIWPLTDEEVLKRRRFSAPGPAHEQMARTARERAYVVARRVDQVVFVGVFELHESRHGIDMLGASFSGYK